MAQPRIELFAVELGSLDQTIDLSDGGGAIYVIAEQPGLTIMFRQFVDDFDARQCNRQ